jgi:hypothetical protein
LNRGEKHEGMDFAPIRLRHNVEAILVHHSGGEVTRITP